MTETFVRATAIYGAQSLRRFVYDTPHQKRCRRRSWTASRWIDDYC